MLPRGQLARDRAPRVLRIAVLMLGTAMLANVVAAAHPQASKSHPVAHRRNLYAPRGYRQKPSGLQVHEDSHLEVDSKSSSSDTYYIGIPLVYKKL